MTYAIVVHGGAGFHAKEDEPRVKAALSRSATVRVNDTQKYTHDPLERAPKLSRFSNTLMAQLSTP